jgi:hypothetical protein
MRAFVRSPKPQDRRQDDEELNMPDDFEEPGELPVLTDVFEVGVEAE